MTILRDKPQVGTPAPHRNRLGKYLMFPLLFGLIGVCFLAQGWRNSVKLSSIRVKGAVSLSRNTVLNTANVPQKGPMFEIDMMSIRQRILSQPVVKEVRINREYPGHLEIEIAEREPLAALNCGQMRYVDDEGVVLPYADGDRKLDLPLIIGIDGIQSEKVGKPILNKELFSALEIIRQAQKLDSAIFHMISELDMNHGGDIRINSMDAGIPVILGREDIPRKLLMFETFWMNFVATEDVQKLKYIDLRYEDQVVVRWSDTPEPQLKKVRAAKS